MDFSQKLDDRPFRLFVLRTWERMQQDSPLSPAENTLATLLREHGEIDLLGGSSRPDIDRQYGTPGNNPFLLLAALWEAQKQLEKDSPRGIVALMKSSFPGEKKRSRIRQILGRLLLVLYFRNGDESMSDKLYLYELARMLEDPLYADVADEEKKQETERFDYHTCNIFDQTITSLKADIYLEASSRSMPVDIKLEAALKNCPGEWITAMSVYWKQPDAGLKRDRIKHLCDFLLDRDSTETILAALDAEERKVIDYLIDHNGLGRYNRLSRLFGDESGDEYWWTTQRPTSTIGRLRSKGLVFVGKIDGKYRAALIPTDLAALLKTGCRLR
jgi:hypothetical protein